MHFTKEFEAYALLLIREMPMARVAELTGESDTRLWRMLFKHVDGAYAGADFSNVCCVGGSEGKAPEKTGAVQKLRRFGCCSHFVQQHNSRVKTELEGELAP